MNWVVTTTKTPLIVVILISLAVGGIVVAAGFAKRKRSVDRKPRAAVLRARSLWISESRRVRETLAL